MVEHLSDTREQIVEGLRQIAPASVAVTGSTHIMRDLNLDSLAVMDFMLTLEDRFDIGHATLQVESSDCGDHGLHV